MGAVGEVQIRRQIMRGRNNDRESSSMDSSRGAVVSFLFASQLSRLTLGSMRPSVKGSHAKSMATGSKCVLHVKRSLWALNHCRHQRYSQPSLSLSTLPSKPDAGFQVEGQIFFCLFLQNKELTQGLACVLKKAPRQILVEILTRTYQQSSLCALTKLWFMQSRITEMQGPALFFVYISTRSKTWQASVKKIVQLIYSVHLRYICSKDIQSR